MPSFVRGRSNLASRSLAFEALENRHLLAVISFLDDNAPWTAEGPAPVLNGQGDNIPAERPVVGAIQAVAADKTSPRILFVGTTNGGVWRSESVRYANDGIDNDKDGLADAADPGNDEIWTAGYNQDNLDNDNDGTTDEADEVHWQPLTDIQKSLSTGDLVIDPTDATGNTLIVGVGRTSSAAFRGGPQIGVLRITNALRPMAAGGATVEELTLGPGRNISGVAAGQNMGGDNIVLVAANSYGVNPASPSLAGVYRVTKPGAADESVTLLSGTGALPVGPAYDVIVDPTNLQRFYVAVAGDAIAGTTGGIFRTDDGGNNWIAVGANNFTNPMFAPAANPNGAISAQTAMMEMALHTSLGNNVLYVAVVNLVPMTSRNELAGVFWTANQGGSWTAMDLPRTMDGGSPKGINVGGQGNKHLSIAADPTNPNLVYIGGDRQPGSMPDDSFGGVDNSIGARNYTGRLFRGNRGVAANGGVPSPQWAPLTHNGTASKSAPHADSRNMTFDKSGNLIEVDDGGIYRRTSPATNTGDWFSIAGTMQTGEVYSVAYDSNSQTIFAGFQDNGTNRQDGGAGPSTVWRQFQGGDGGDVAVDIFTLDNQDRSIRYSSSQNLSGLRRTVHDENNGVVSETALGTLPGGFTPSFVTPIEVNAVRPTAAQLAANQSTRLVIGADTVFEANNAGTAATNMVTWTQVPTAMGFNGVNRAAMSYGGHRGGAGITAATNASPIVITSAAHGLANGNQVEIEDVLGNTAANGSFIVTVIDANRFSLTGSTGNGAYVSGGFWRQANPDALYVGSGNQVWARTTSGGMLSPGGALTDSNGNAAADIRDVIVDPNDWMIAYAADEAGHVYKTTDAGTTWNDVTGNLLGLLESTTNQRSQIDANLWAMEVIRDVVLPSTSRTPQGMLVVGGAYGVFYQTADVDITGAPIWKRLGAGMPNAIVFDLDQGVDEVGNVTLVASTLGRGAWSFDLPQSLSLPQLADLIGPSGLGLNVSGTTIITHGFEPFDAEGDSMLPLAKVIRERADAANGPQDAWLVDYDASTGRFDPVDSQLPGGSNFGDSIELVIMFDWSEGSQHLSPGWAEAAGDALFGMVAGLGLVDPQFGIAETSLHFIGHGTGAVVTSEAVERLAYYNVPVDHVTYLDPHDFDQGLLFDGAQQLSALGQPTGYGAAVWSNVAFADVYYQTRGMNGSSVSDTIVPEGRPIPGAFNFFIDAANHLPAGSYGAMNVFGDHRYVWEGFYLSTVNGATPQANQMAGLTEDTPAPATAIPTNSVGYAFSRIKATAARPDERFFAHRNRGAWAPGVLYEEFDRVQFGGQEFVALRTHTSRNTGISEPMANQPPDADFWELQLDAAPLAPQDHRHSPSDIVDATTGAPNMAGLLGRRIAVDQLTNGRQRPRWNPLDIVNGGFDQVGDMIGFDQRRLPGFTDFAAMPLFDPVDVTIDIVGRNVTLDTNQPGITHNWVFIPPEAERLSIDVKVTRFSGNDRLEVLLGDTVLMEEDPASDNLDLTFIDADFITHRFVIPSSLHGKVENLSVRLNDGGDNAFNAEVAIDNMRFEGYVFEVLAGDVSLIDLGAVIGGSSFALLNPLILDAGEAIRARDVDPAEALFSTTGRLYFVPDFETDGNSITFDDDNATAGDDDFATIRFMVDYGSGAVERSARVRVVDGHSTTGPNSIFLTG
jgi:hypothetical protein